MSGGVPDGVVKGLWAAIRSRAFDNLMVLACLFVLDVCAFLFLYALWGDCSANIYKDK